MLCVPLGEQKDLSRWRKVETAGRVGGGVTSITAALLNRAVTTLTLSLSPLILTQPWDKDREGNVLILQETEVSLLQLNGSDV